MLSHSDKADSILIVRLSSLGDILLTTHALRCLRHTFPNTQIDFLIRDRYQELLTGNSDVSNVIPFPEPADATVLNKAIDDLYGKYETVIDLHTSLRSSFLRKRLGAKTVLKYDKKRFKRWMLVHLHRDHYPKDFSIPLAYLEAMTSLGVEDDGEGLSWPAAVAATPGFLDKIEMDTAPAPKPIAICPGASFPTKRWQDGAWINLAKELLKKDHELWIFGDNTDRNVGEKIAAIRPEKVRNFCGKTDFVESGAGLSLCQYAITHDAGPSHMATAVGTPVVAIFGSTALQFGFRPFRIPHRIAQVELSCRPCSHLGFAECPKSHFRCMKDIKVDQVMELIEDLEREIGI